MAQPDVTHIAVPNKVRREGSVALNIPGTGTQFLDVGIVEQPLSGISGQLEDQFDRSDQHIIVDDTVEPILEIVRDTVPGQRIMRGLGERESIDTTANGEDIWRGNELSNTPAALASHTSMPIPATTGEQMSIISENDADNGGTATGALTVEIQYLDADGTEQITIATMNGTTTVVLTPANIRFVNDMYVKTVGSNGVAEGNIRIYKTADATLVYNMILGGGNKSLVPHRMVPVGKCLYLREWTCSEGRGKRLLIRLRSDCNDTVPPIRQPEVFLFKSTHILNAGSSGAMPLAYAIPAFSIVKVSGWAVAAGGDASVHWWGVLVDD